MAKMGRPRTFDRDEAVEQAMHIFWQYGFEATSIAMLRTAIGDGINAPSFYAAFNSKESLFREVVERYVATYGQVNASLWDETLPPREAVELSLRRSARMQTEEGHPRGCLLVASANLSAPEHEDVQKLLAGFRNSAREGFRRSVERAVSLGDLPENTNVTAYAAVLHTFLHGFSVQARDGVSGATLDAAITQIMGIWDMQAKFRET